MAIERKTTGSRMTIEDNPYYFAHYANMAHHNVYIILKELSLKLEEIKLNIEEDNISNSINPLLKLKRPDEVNRVVTYLLMHFPFLYFYYNENDTERIVRVFQEYFNALHQLRNETSHYAHEHKPIKIESLKDLFDYAVERAKQRMVTFTDEDFDNMYRPDQFLDFHQNDDLTKDGIYFLMCLFLERKYAFQFLGRIQYFKNTTESRYRAKLESYVQFSCKIPYPKLESSSIVLDMLNELNRCPNSLYNVLSDEDKNSFKVKSSLDEEEAEPIMKRYGSRFPYFALRFFDESKSLEGITFQLNLGRRYRKESHQKKLVGEIRTHHLLKEMHTFGMLSYYETEHARSFYTDRLKSEVEFYSPKYQITGNRIGLSLQHPTIPLAYRLIKRNLSPDAILSVHELHSLFFYNYLYKKGEITISPKQLIQDFIENFKRFITDLQDKKIEPEVIHDKFKKQKKHTEEDLSKLEAAKVKLNEKLKHYNLSINNIPDACREYLLSYTPASLDSMIEEKFKIMLKEAKKAIQLSESIKEDGFKTSRRRLKTGEIAQELANDIVFLTPPRIVEVDGVEHKKKINNQEYDLLQKMLAYFPSYKNDLKEHLELLKDKQKDRWGHPFLDSVVRYELNSCRTLIDFYAAYNRRKKKWILREIINEDKQRHRISLRKDPAEICKTYNYFLKINIKDALFKQYNTDCIFLPTGLFDDGINKAMKSKGTKEGDNSAYAIKLFFEGKSQSFLLYPVIIMNHHVMIKIVCWNVLH